MHGRSYLKRNKRFNQNEIFNFGISISISISISILVSCKNNSTMSLDKTDDRVVNAQKVYQQSIEKDLVNHGIDIKGYEVFLQAFKAERVLEVWVKNKTESKWAKLSEYPFCQFSGQLGPKRKEGDLQIPEGFYHIDRYNPKSNFYLSLGLNYPNAADLHFADAQRPGGDIFIHGGCKTVGCIPITDEKIAPLYLLTLAAFDQGQAKIPMHIYPTKLTDENLIVIGKEYPQHLVFWRQLKVAYEYFDRRKELIDFEVGATGEYVF